MHIYSSVKKQNVSFRSLTVPFNLQNVMVSNPLTTATKHTWILRTVPSKFYFEQKIMLKKFLTFCNYYILMKMYLNDNSVRFIKVGPYW